MFGGSGGPFVCMACGTDLWDVPRYLRAGGVTICPACVEVTSVLPGGGFGLGGRVALQAVAAPPPPPPPPHDD